MPVPCEQCGVDPLQVGLGQRAQERPGELERLLDAPAVAALVDERLLEVVGEGEIAAVSFRERRLADDRDEPAQVAPTCQRGVELVGDGSVVLAGLVRPDAGVHESAQRRQHVDWRVDAEPVELS